MFKKTVVFDFDGVIHSYTSGWQGNENIPDPPVNGIKETIETLRKNNYSVIVVSTRCRTPSGTDAIKQYLQKYSIIVDGVQKEKPPATCYVDDRAICFTGDTSNLVNQITSFKSWTQKK